MLKHIIVCSLLVILVVPLLSNSAANQVYDLVILNGRVIDPEARLDAVRNIGVSAGT